MPFGFVNPFTNRPAPAPAMAINANNPPWAYTFSRAGKVLSHPTDHQVVGHPNAVHFPMPHVTPFIEGAGAAAGRAGNARVPYPRLGGVGGLSRGVRR